MSEVDGGAGGEACGLCGREVRELTRHHLVPRTRHKKNKRKRRTLDRRDLHRTVGLCAPCHRHVHRTIPNKELEREYDSVEALRKHPDVDRFVAWIRNKPHGTARSGGRRGFG